MQLPHQSNIITTRSDHARQCKPVKPQTKLSNFLKEPQRGPTLTPISISSYKGVVRDNVWLGNFIEHPAGNVDKGVFGIGIDEGVVGEDIGVLGEVEGSLGIVEGATFGVEEGEVVGTDDGCLVALLISIDSKAMWHDSFSLVIWFCSLNFSYSFILMAQRVITLVFFLL